MKTNYVYAAIVIVLIILGFVFWGGDDAAQTSEMATSTATSTIPSTSGTSAKPSGTVTSPKPSTTKPATTNPTAPGLPPAPAPGTPTYATLNGKILRLSSYNGKAVSADYQYTVSFENGRLSAKFCNGLGGEYVLDGNKISSSNLVGTKMFCATPSDLMDIESSFANALNFGATISVAGNNLILTSKDTLMSFSGFEN